MEIILPILIIMVSLVLTEAALDKVAKTRIFIKSFGLTTIFIISLCALVAIIDVAIIAAYFTPPSSPVYDKPIKITKSSVYRDANSDVLFKKGN